jgi:hypothetical protein
MLYVKLIKYLRVSIERSFYNCYDSTLITEPKTFAIQNISGIFPGELISGDCGKLGASRAGGGMNGNGH